MDKYFGKVFVEWLDDDGKYKLSAIPIHKYLWGRLCSWIGRSGAGNICCTHVPCSRVTFEPSKN